MNKKLLFTVLLTGTMLTVFAQKISGDISVLKTQKEVNLVLEFTKPLVNGKSEAQFIKEETKGKSKSDKDQWISEWNEKLRADAYDLLVKDLNKVVSEKYFTVGDFPDAEYIIVVKVKEITTGYFIGIGGKASAVIADVRFVKNGDKKPLSVVDFKKTSSKISGTVPYFVSRIAMSFGTLGDNIGKAILKKLK